MRWRWRGKRIGKRRVEDREKEEGSGYSRK